jgi:hypothetical protein
MPLAVQQMGVKMNEKIEFALRTVLIGAGATMAMDLWALLPYLSALATALLMPGVR